MFAAGALDFDGGLNLGDIAGTALHERLLLHAMPFHLRHQRTRRCFGTVNVCRTHFGTFSGLSVPLGAFRCRFVPLTAASTRRARFKNR
jgi:hypothetical protein